MVIEEFYTPENYVDGEMSSLEYSIYGWECLLDVKTQKVFSCMKRLGGVNGISVYDNRDKMMTVLGEPFAVLNFDGIEINYYQYDDYVVGYGIEEGIIIMITISNNDVLNRY